MRKLCDRDQAGNHVAGMTAATPEIGVAHIQRSDHYPVRERGHFRGSADVASPNARLGRRLISSRKGTRHDADRLVVRTESACEGIDEMALGLVQRPGTEPVKSRSLSKCDEAARGLVPRC